MRGTSQHIRHGIVGPYLYGDLKLPELLKHAFGAQELERLPVGNGFHIEARIGDSMIGIEAGDPPHPGGTRASIYVYVEDMDAAYRRALEAGVKDSYGNTWWLATYTG
jgi:PhnB protein